MKSLFLVTFFVFTSASAFFLSTAGAQEVDVLQRALKREGNAAVTAPTQKEDLAPGKPVLIDRVVAIVNTEIILASDFERLQKLLKTPDFIDEGILGNQTPEAVAKDRKLLLDYLIAEKIMGSEIKRLNLEVTSDKVDQEIAMLAQRNGMRPEDVYRAVGERGFSQAQYRDYLKTKLERGSLIETEIISRLRISDDDAFSEYLKSNPNSKPTAEEYSLAHIFFSPKKGGGALAAQERAKQALQKIRAGQDFEKLAEQVSEDSQFATGGYLGTFKTGEFVKELENAVSSLQPGDVSNVVQTRQGFHIVKVINKKLTTDPQFERVKDRIKAELMDKALFRQVAIWLQNKKDEAYVKINEYQK